MRVPFHPGLYDPEAGEPALIGVRCARCTTAFFPPFDIGCEVCGAPATELTSELLAASGVVHSVATVHRYAGDDVDAPFTMAEIRLDAGPLVRATLTDVVDPAAIGARAEGRWVPVGVGESGDEITELRFRVVEL